MEILAELPQSDFDRFRGVEHRAYLIKAMPRARSIRQWTKGKPGSVYYRAYALTHQRSNRASDTYIVQSEYDGEHRTGNVQQARDLYCALTGRVDPPYTYSGIARKLTEWLDVRDVFGPPRFRELCPAWHYQSCVPGEYTDAAMYDLRSAYWQMACRCKSPLVDVYGGKIMYRVVPPASQSSWDAIREQVSAHKRLRLALIGVNSVGWRGVPAPRLRGVVRYANGQRIGSGSPVGTLVTMSALAVRATYEVEQIQSAASGSVYSNGDCVVASASEVPQYWHDAGLQYTVKGNGAATIQHVCSYRIGDVQTVPFRANCNSILRVQKPALVLSDTHWHAELLHCYDCLADHQARHVDRRGIL